MALRNIIHYIQLMLDVSIVAWSIKISMKVQKKKYCFYFTQYGLKKYASPEINFLNSSGFD